jgi:hypothetical protein
MWGACPQRRAAVLRSPAHIRKDPAEFRTAPARVHKQPVVFLWRPVRVYKQPAVFRRHPARVHNQPAVFRARRVAISARVEAINRHPPAVAR